MGVSRKPKSLRFPTSKAKSAKRSGSASWLDKRATWLKKGLTLSHSLEEKKRMRALLKETKEELRRLKLSA